MKKINWGIIGLGNIANSFSEGFSNINNSNLLGIASLNPEKLEKFKKKFNIKKEFTFNNYEELLNCKEIDIVYITLPNVFHYDLIIKCIDNNKKILVEKPAVLNLEQAKIIKQKVNEKQIFFTEGYMYRYHPQIKDILKIIKDNEIGELTSMVSSFGKNLLTKKKFLFFNKKKTIDHNNRLFNKKLGGGCILDLGCYPSSFSLLIASVLKNVNYKNFKILNIKKEMGETGVEVDSEAVIRFEDGFNSTIKSSFKKDIGSTSIINGNKGSIIIKNTWYGDGIKKIIGNTTYETKKNNYQNIFSYEIESISKAILDGLKQVSFPGMSLDDTILNTKILEEWLNA